MAPFMTAYDELEAQLAAAPRTWLVTGVAGFIGSNLLEALLRLGQTVRGLDNFATGKRRNLDEVKSLVTTDQWARFTFVEGDIRDLAICRHACQGTDYVLHQAALGSVPRSIENPVASTEANVNGTLHVLIAARDQRVRRVVYASSSSVYGDHPVLPKVEAQIGQPLSPYAVTKRSNELYAEVFARCYALEVIGLRYFNVFGPRQDPDGPYAAVIPKWIAALLRNEPVQVNGDGTTSRDFCYVANVVQANLLAATTPNREALNQVYNVALGGRTTLNELFALLRDLLAPDFAAAQGRQPVYQDFRPGDVRHSLADISKAEARLGYAPTHPVAEGLKAALAWYVQNVV
jgi:UDP-N-acetylglucosamine/UDP-N-acetylgalactosamine 4-epimerase